MIREIENVRVRPGQFVTRQGLLRLLAAWAKGAEAAEKSEGGSATGGAGSVYLRPGEARQHLQAQGSPEAEWVPGLASLGPGVQESETGLACFRMGSTGLAVVPPFPFGESRVEDKLDFGPLSSLLDAEYLVGVVLLRLGRFSAAVFRGRNMLTSKTDSRYVKGRHSAGGTSQKRFERIREGQIHRIYGKASQAVEAQLGPYAGALDFITLGGESGTLNGFLKECPFLQRHRDLIQMRRLNVRDPKRDSLERAGEMLWESRVWPLDLG